MRGQYSSGSMNNLQETFDSVELTDNDANASKMPLLADLVTLALYLTNVATATTVTWYLSQDEDGDFALTDEFTSTLRADGVTAGRAFIVADVSPAMFLSTPRVSTPGSCWLRIKVDDADGCDLASAELRWKEQVNEKRE